MKKSIKKVIAKGIIRVIPLTTYQAGVLQATTHRNLQKYCDDVLRAYGITKTQWFIIGTILDAGSSGIRVTDLAEKVGTTLSYLTNTINLLESKDIVQRVARGEDNRVKYVSIVENYTKTCTEIERYLRDKLRTTIYGSIEPEDFRTYMKVLTQLSSVQG